MKNGATSLPVVWYKVTQIYFVTLNGSIFLEIVSFQLNCDCLSGTEIIERNITVENKGEIILIECQRKNRDKREKNHEN